LVLEKRARGYVRENLATADHFRSVAFAVVAGVLGLALVAMLYFARRMALDVLRPVEALRQGVDRVRDGELDHRVEVSSRHRSSELTDLATGFNEMAGALTATHRELTFRAMHDSLTGLPNRLALREHLSAAFAEADGRCEQPDVSVLFVDLDDFKVVNDTLGHAGGDELLVQVADRLAACARLTDIVGRLGGDEFAIVVTSNAARSAPEIAERVLGALSAPFVVQGRTLSVSASIGVGTTRPETSCAEELLANADFAMYMAKGHGKQRHELYDPALHAVTTDHAALRSDLPHAVENGELRLDYQPVMDLSTGAVVGMEALLRWHHPVRGLVPPLDFIPLAEQSGDIDDIGLWTLRTATDQLARWRRTGGTYANLWMAVNLSPMQLRNERVVSQLTERLATGPVPAEAVVFEVTESALVLGVDGAVEALQALKDTGARIALDDFGTGLSSLSTLAGLPVDILKIDRAFVSGQDGGIPSTPVLRTVVALAEHLGLEVIAEGVEQAEQTAALRALGCQLGQGFGLARPNAPDLITALLNQPPPPVEVPAPRAVAAQSVPA
jgi:diguanylate cyclase (GGDEF)-like protein